jgi:hypothetical protein
MIVQQLVQLDWRSRMFAVHCPDHDHRVLLAWSRVRGVATTPAGIVVSWRCWCGHEGTATLGRRSRTALPTPDEAA